MPEHEDAMMRNLLTARHNQIWFDRRYCDQAAWQIPSIVITLTSVVFGISFSIIHVALVSAFVLLFGGLFVLFGLGIESITANISLYLAGWVMVAVSAVFWILEMVYHRKRR